MRADMGGGIAAAATAALGVALAFAAIAGVEGGSEAPAPSPAAGLRLALVDVDRVLDQSEQWADFQEEHRLLQEKRRRTLDKLRARIRILRSEYENLPPETEERAAKKAEIEQALGDYDKTRQGFESQLADQRTRALRNMFNRINEVVRAYAEEKELDLVLKRQDLRVSADKPVEMGVLLATADVLYARSSFDITVAIVQRLNESYPTEITDR